MEPVSDVIVISYEGSKLMANRENDVPMWSQSRMT